MNLQLFWIVLKSDCFPAENCQNCVTSHKWKSRQTKKSRQNTKSIKNGTVQMSKTSSHESILFWTSSQCLWTLYGAKTSKCKSQNLQKVTRSKQDHQDHQDLTKIAKWPSWTWPQKFYFLQCVVQSYLQWLQDSDYNPNVSQKSNTILKVKFLSEN